MKAVFNPFTESLDFVGTTASKFRVTCLATDQVGHVVGIAGDMIGGAYQVSRADILNFTTAVAFGILVRKSSDTTGVVVTGGLVAYPSLIPGRLYFTGDSGFPTAIRPVAASPSGVFVQVIGKAISTTKLLLEISPNLTKVLP